MAKKKKSRKSNRIGQPQSSPSRRFSGTPLLVFENPSGAVTKLLIVLQLLLLAYQFTPQLSTNGDNAVYYFLGKSLAKGTGYRNICLVNKPIESTYPVLTPLFISLSQFFAPTPLLPKILMAFLGALVTLMCYYLFKSYLSFQLLTPLLLLTAASGLMADYQLILMSETPYLLLTLCALFARCKSIEAPENRIFFWIALTLSVLPVHARSIGIVFSAAWITDELLQKRYKSAILHALLVGTTILLFRSLVPDSSAYANSPFLKNAYDPEMGYITFHDLKTRIITNIKVHLTTLFPRSFIPFTSSKPGAFQMFVAAGMMIASFVGWFFCFRRTARIFSIYVLFYTGLICIWPIANDRRICPLMPFLLFFFITGLTIILRIPLLPEKRFVSTLKKLSAGFNRLHLTKAKYGILWICVAIIFTMNVHYRIRNPLSPRHGTPDWKNFYSCADWIRNNTPENSVIVNRKPELFYLRSHRAGCMYLYSHDVDKIIQDMKRKNVTHVVYDNFAWTRTTAKYLYPVIASHPELFDVVYALKNPDTFVLAFRNK
ncbi:MAG: hypothetical protein GF350_00405 [Chitinivibrionales bacterium]|nr:hypothetical protein [Chitinivibrionales bacterium]